MTRLTRTFLSAAGTAALLVAGTAPASEPISQQGTQAPAAASMKIGIDPVTGKRRQLTEAESAALDAQAATNAAAKGARTKGAAMSRFPATVEESMANKRVVNGIISFKPIAGSFSSVTVTRGNDGKLSFQENGAPMEAQKQEAARE